MHILSLLLCHYHLTYLVIFIVSHFISSVFKSVLYIHLIILADDGCNTATASFQTNRSQDNREVVCSLIHNTVDRANFSILLRALNIMLRITQSTREGVSSSRLKQLGVDLMSHVRSAFVNHQGQPWINITPSLHAMCAHDWQLVVILDAPVAIYSEQAQEHWNKYLTKYKSRPSARARQHNVSLNIYDTFVRMLTMTHPMVAGKKRQAIVGRTL